MDVRAFLEELKRDPRYAGQLAHVEELPPRPARFGLPRQALPAALQQFLRCQGIEQLYQHQAAALDAARSRQNVLVVSGTASGKTLCYNLPILETCLADPEARALYLFPTKALAQDQLKGQLELIASNPQDGAADSSRGL